MTAATYPATPDGLTAALNALGDTAAEVADTLARAGFSGRRGDEDEREKQGANGER